MYIETLPEIQLGLHTDLQTHDKRYNHVLHLLCRYGSGIQSGTTLQFSQPDATRAKSGRLTLQSPSKSHSSPI